MHNATPSEQHKHYQSVIEDLKARLQKSVDSNEVLFKSIFNISYESSLVI